MEKFKRKRFFSEEISSKIEIGGADTGCSNSDDANGSQENAAEKLDEILMFQEEIRALAQQAAPVVEQVPSLQFTPLTNNLMLLIENGCQC